MRSSGAETAFHSHVETEIIGHWVRALEIAHVLLDTLTKAEISRVSAHVGKWEISMCEARVEWLTSVLYLRQCVCQDLEATYHGRSNRSRRPVIQEDNYNSISDHYCKL